MRWLAYLAFALFLAGLLARVVWLLRHGRPNYRPPETAWRQGAKITDLGTSQIPGTAPDDAAKRKKLGIPEPTLEDDDEEGV
jgi:hypothetical protein